MRLSIMAILLHQNPITEVEQLNMVEGMGIHIGQVQLN